MEITLTWNFQLLNEVFQSFYSPLNLPSSSIGNVKLLLQAPEGASEGGNPQVWVQPDGKKSDGQTEATWSRNFPFTRRWLNRRNTSTHVLETHEHLQIGDLHLIPITVQDSTLSAVPLLQNKSWLLSRPPISLPPTHSKLPVSPPPVLLQSLEIRYPSTHSDPYISYTATVYSNKPHHITLSQSDHSAFWYCSLHCCKGKVCLCLSLLNQIILHMTVSHLTFADS